MLKLSLAFQATLDKFQVLEYGAGHYWLEPIALPPPGLPRGLSRPARHTPAPGRSAEGPDSFG